MLAYSARIGLRPALGAFSLTCLVACHGTKGLKRFKFFTTVSNTGSILARDKEFPRCYSLRWGNYSACRANLRAGRVRFSSSFPATDEVDWTDSAGEKKLAVEVSRESVTGVELEEHTKYIPVKAFFLSTSVDLKSLQVEHFFDIVPHATRNANYAILKYSNTLQHHKSNVAVNDIEERRESWSNGHYMVVFQYGSVVLFNIADHEEEGYLQIAKKYASGLLSEARKDDYAVVEKPSLETWMQGGPDYIVLKRLDIDGIRIIGSVLGQSIALDHFVRQVDGMVAEFTDLNRGMEKTGTFTMKQEKLFQLVGKANSNLADVILKLGLFERSDIAWKNANYAQIWEYLRDEYELTQRFGSLDFKLKFVEHNVRYFLEILQNRKSDFLEWLIIILISAEIVIAIYNIVRESEISPI